MQQQIYYHFICYVPTSFVFGPTQYKLFSTRFRNQCKVAHLKYKSIIKKTLDSTFHLDYSYTKKSICYNNREYQHIVIEKLFHLMGIPNLV